MGRHTAVATLSQRATMNRANIKKPRIRRREQPTRVDALVLSRVGARLARSREPVRPTPDAVSILAFSDARVQDLSILVEYVTALDPKPDLILYAGDDVDRFHPGKKTNYFAQLAARATYGLVAVIGNDDEPHAARLITGDRVYDAHGRALLLGPFAVVGVGGAPLRMGETNIGMTLYPEPQMSAFLEDGLTGAGNRTVVLLSHTPPRGILDRAIRFGESNIGSDAVASMLEVHGHRVPLVVCGHVHGFGGRDALHRDDRLTVVVNAASHDTPLSPLKIAQVTVTLSLSGDGRTALVSPVRWDTLSPVRIARPAGAPSLRVPWTQGDLHRVNQVGWVRQQQLSYAGINTVQGLATAPPALIGKALMVRDEVAQGFVTRARAIHLKRPIPLSPLRLPPGARVFLDIETDLSQEHMWMCGCLDGVTGEFMQFESPSLKRRDEGAMLDALTAWLAAREDAIIVHYSGSNFDGRIVRSRLGAFKMPCPPDDRMVDAMPHVRRAIAPACGRYALKEIAASAGYLFRHPHMDGLSVAMTYLDRLGRRLKQPVTPALREYNEDDVRSVAHVCQWVEAHCGAEPLVPRMKRRAVPLS